MWTRKTTQQLTTAAVFALIRGAATAAGSAAVAVSVWWLQHH
ncbi:hypothetical protein ACIBCO_40535 [Streptomyces violascens]